MPRVLLNVVEVVIAHKETAVVFSRHHPANEKEINESYARAIRHWGKCMEIIAILEKPKCSNG